MNRASNNLPSTMSGLTVKSKNEPSENLVTSNLATSDVDDFRFCADWPGVKSVLRDEILSLKRFRFRARLLDVVLAGVLLGCKGVTFAPLICKY